MGRPYESPPRNHNWNVYFWPWRLEVLPLELLGFWALQSESASCLSSHQQRSGGGEELLDAQLHNKNHSKLRARVGICELRTESKRPCSTPASATPTVHLAWETKDPNSTPPEAPSLFMLTHFKGLFLNESRMYVSVCGFVYRSGRAHRD